MAKLNPDQKAFIVNRLAIFETPSQVAYSLERRYGVSLTRQAIENYDPSKVKGRRLSKKWREMFEQARAKYVAALSNRAVTERLGAIAAEAVSEMLEAEA